MKNHLGARKWACTTAGMAGLFLAASPAFATVAAVPEPSVLGLLAAGAIAGGILYLRKRRK